jgi:parvulin-like peptidyl-prolyl isomerase
VIWILLALLAGQQADLPPASPTESLASFRDGALTSAEVDAWLRHRPPTKRRSRERRIEERVLLEVLNRRFREAGLEPTADYRAWLRLLEERLAAAALQKTVFASTAVPAAEIEAAFAARPQAFDSERRYQLQNLFLAFPPGSGPEDRDRLRREMEELRRRLLAGADFAALARELSASATRNRGGHLGTAALSGLRPEVARAVAGLEKGGLSAIVETADGLTLLRCVDVLPAVTLSPEEKRRRHAEELRKKKAERDWRDATARLLADARPDYRLPLKASPDSEAAVFAWQGQRETILRRDLDFHLRDQRSAPAESLPAAALRSRLEELVLQRARALEAERLGATREPDYLERLRWEKLEMQAELVLMPEIAARMTPPAPEEAQALFERRRDDLVAPEALTFRVLEVPILAERPASFYRQLQTAGAALGRGEIDFDELGRRLGEAARLVEHAGALPNYVFQQGANVEAALRQLQPGGASGPHQEGRTLVFVHLVSRREPRPLSFAEARPQLEASLQAAKREKIRSGLRAEILRQQEVRIDP